MGRKVAGRSRGEVANQYGPPAGLEEGHQRHHQSIPPGVQVDDIRFVLESITLGSRILMPSPRIPLESLLVVELFERQCSILEAEKEG